MKIGIIIHAAGHRYRGYAQNLLKTIHLFLPQFERTSILFTDGVLESPIPIITSDIPSLPKPLNTLLRFHYILQSDFSGFDLLYYIDADCEVVAPVGNEVLPDKIGQMVVVKHPWETTNSTFYETHPNSTAKVLDSKGRHYYQGCFFGGFRDDFLEMATVLDANIKKDLENRLIARWYDESHMNRYFVLNPPKELPSSYAYPGRGPQEYPFSPIIKHYNYGSVD